MTLKSIVLGRAVSPRPPPSAYDFNGDDTVVRIIRPFGALGESALPLRNPLRVMIRLNGPLGLRANPPILSPKAWRCR